MTWKIVTWLEVNEGDEDGELDKGVNVTVYNQGGWRCFHLTADSLRQQLKYSN